MYLGRAPPLTVPCDLHFCLQICLGFVQFGFVAIYLSEAFIRGFMTAAGLQILISVLKYIFGVTIASYTGPLAIVYVSEPSGTDDIIPPPMPPYDITICK